MSIEFGEIQNYDTNRGFGFVNRKFGTTQKDRVFFHIKKVKHKYPELARKIDTNSYSGVSFWYSVEITEKGPQVSEIWLQENELPSKMRDEIIHNISLLWKNIFNGQLPKWLDEITIRLCGQNQRNALLREREQLIKKQEKYEAEKKRVIEEQRRKKLEEIKLIQIRAIQKAEEKQRLEFEHQEKLRLQHEEKEQKRKNKTQELANSIQHFCNEHNITHLVHFTSIQNLGSILEKGLLGRDVLELWEEMSQHPKFNDNDRIEGHLNAICLSISFPNYQMFYKYRIQDKEDGWVVLILKSDILWELDCAFCQENAASNNVKMVPLLERKEVSSFKKMFDDYSDIKRQSLGIPDL